MKIVALFMAALFLTISFKASAAFFPARCIVSEPPFSAQAYRCSGGFCSAVGLRGATFIRQLWNIPGERDLWQRVGDYGRFDVPPDLKPYAAYRFDAEHWLWVYRAGSDTVHDYWYAFSHYAPFARSDGKYYGNHPCAAWSVERLAAL